MSNSLLSQIIENINNSRFHESELLAWDLYNKNKTDFNIVKTLALTLLLQNKYNGSIDFYLKAEKINSNDFDVINNIAHLYLKIEEFEKSYAYAKRAQKLNGEAYQSYITLLELYLRKREFETAYSYTDEILKRIKFEQLIKNPNVIYIILDTYFALFKKDEALKFIEYAYKKTFNPEIFYYHSTFSPETITDEFINSARKILKFDGYKNHIEKGKTVGPILFGLAKYYENKKDIETSDEYYLSSNKEISNIQRYQPLLNQKLIHKIKKIFSSEEKLPFEKRLGEGLIFIVGMPRSGTTLIESIIASAPDTISGGELISFYDLIKASLEDDEDSVFHEDPGTIYENRIKFIRQDNKFFIDKLPGNYQSIGYINHIFPKAKIIYVRRDPWDNAISLFKQFYVSNIPYASTFFNIAVIYANHEELIRYWGNTLNINFLTIEYEDLVKNTSEMAELIFDHCNINHKYNPEKRKKFFARTASKNQVNKDVHTSSIGKKSFENFKEEFQNCLENQREYWLNSK
tara:strand:- start:933 stop:2486 length:1554 start_codon:yes stop_codon:yes gene_type:complete